MILSTLVCLVLTADEDDNRLEVVSVNDNWCNETDEDSSKSGFAVSDDGSLIGAIHSSSQLVRWHIATGCQTDITPSCLVDIAGLGMSRDGRMIAIVSSSPFAQSVCVKTN